MTLLEFGLLQEPQWRPCRGCGCDSSVDPCWDCEMRAERRRQAVEALPPPSVPPRYAWARFESPDLTVRLQAYGRKPWLCHVLAQCRCAVESPRVLLLGPSGAGKSTVAAAMVRAWEQRHRKRALWQPARRLAGGVFELREELLEAPLVVLDDLGAESELASNLVPRLIDERHDADMALWVTTWLTAPQLVQRYGDGRTRRLVEGITPIKFGPPLEAVAR